MGTAVFSHTSRHSKETRWQNAPNYAYDTNTWQRGFGKEDDDTLDSLIYRDIHIPVTLALLTRCTIAFIFSIVYRTSHQEVAQ